MFVLSQSWQIDHLHSYIKWKKVPFPYRSTANSITIFSSGSPTCTKNALVINFLLFDCPVNARLVRSLSGQEIASQKNVSEITACFWRAHLDCLFLSRLRRVFRRLFALHLVRSGCLWSRVGGECADSQQRLLVLDAFGLLLLLDRDLDRVLRWHAIRELPRRLRQVWTRQTRQNTTFRLSFPCVCLGN
eukprot:COSAG06_NODE_383_length_16525_cov_86.720017_11_plen_189_part_00